jgi:predicted RNase H-like HicB family nuclease
MKTAVRIAGLLNGAYRAWCPALPGCVVYGRSRREAKARIRQAVAGYVEHLDFSLPRELGRAIEAGSRTAWSRVEHSLPH